MRDHKVSKCKDNPMLFYLFFMQNISIQNISIKIDARESY